MLYEIESCFKGTRVTEAGLEAQIISQDFFRHSLIEHIWEIYTPGREGLDRAITIKEQFQTQNKSVTFSYDTGRERNGLFGEVVVYRHIERVAMQQLTASINLEDFRSEGKETAFQEWILNASGNTGGTVSFISYLRQNICCHQPSPELLENISHSKPLVLLTPFSHTQFDDEVLWLKEAKGLSTLESYQQNTLLPDY